MVKIVFWGCYCEMITLTRTRRVMSKSHKNLATCIRVLTYRFSTQNSVWIGDARVLHSDAPRSADELTCLSIVGPREVPLGTLDSALVHSLGTYWSGSCSPPHTHNPLTGLTQLA